METNKNIWPMGVFTSVGSGLGLSMEVLRRLEIPTIHLHAPRKTERTPAHAASLVDRLRSMNVEVTCVFAGFAGESYADIPTVKATVGLVPLQTRAERAAELKEIIDFAAQLKVSAVGLHLGFLPHEASTAGYNQLVEVTRDLCDYALRQGQAIHLETGQEPAGVLLNFLGAVERQNLFVNFDPANMILYGCGEPLEALAAIGPHVRSVHCKDAKWSDRPGETWGTEVPLGEGDVDFSRFLQILANIGYSGPLTIEREIPQEPERQLIEVGRSVELLDQLKAHYQPSSH